jgi:hypothetical protein
MVPLRAILVCVDFDDLLEVTLPFNRHHFQEVVVVTAPRDRGTRRVAKKHRCRTLVTEAFWSAGADFNKWKALEEGLDFMGREGWICILDADVVWPADAEWQLEFGCLHSPLRRILEEVTLPLPKDWDDLPIDFNVGEWAGYTQIFHAQDPVLGRPPWHETNWRHAGGADSFFQAKWPAAKKCRPPWCALHLGPVGVNWCGRVARYLDGSIPPKAAANHKKLHQYLTGRTRSRNADPCAYEKLPVLDPGASTSDTTPRKHGRKRRS